MRVRTGSAGPQCVSESEWLPMQPTALRGSVETSRYAFRLDHLRTVGAVVRFVSAEPLLGPLSDLDLSGLHWLIAGGESGPSARPMHES